MRILVTGSRDWDDEDAIRGAIASQVSKAGPENVTIVHGACPTGADEMADRIATGWGGGMSVERHAADWKNLGKRAGFVRNAEMAELGADLCLAFIKNNSKGASMMANLADEAGIPVREFRT